MIYSGPLGTKNRSRANCVPINSDLYQNLQWSLTFNLKVVTHFKSASEASYDVIDMATIIRNCPLIKAIVCVGMVIFIQHEHSINYFSHMMVTSMLYLTLTMNYWTYFNIVDRCGILPYKRIYPYKCGIKINFDILTTQKDQL